MEAMSYLTGEQQDEDNMRKLVLGILFSCILHSPVCAQENGLVRDSLPVFIIQDREFASIVDEFIADVKRLDNKTTATFRIDIDIVKDAMYMWLSHIELNRNPNRQILYKSAHDHWAFIRHQNVLFPVNIRSYVVSFNYYILTEMLKVLPEKQDVYFKDFPSDFDDRTSVMGNVLFFLDYRYDGTKWHKGILEDE
jgi:hypothetical protein